MGIFLQIKKFAILHKWWLLLITFLTIIGLYIAAMFILIIIVLVYWYTQKIKKERSNMSKLSDLTKDISTSESKMKIGIENENRPKNLKLKNYKDIIKAMNFWTISHLPELGYNYDLPLYNFSKFFVVNKDNKKIIIQKINEILAIIDKRNLSNFIIKNNDGNIDGISFILLFLLMYELLEEDYDNIHSMYPKIYRNFYKFFNIILNENDLLARIYLNDDFNQLYKNFLRQSFDNNIANRLMDMNKLGPVKVLIYTGARLAKVKFGGKFNEKKIFDKMKSDDDILSVTRNNIRGLVEYVIRQ
jgi:hypothetical protein